MTLRATREDYLSKRASKASRKKFDAVLVKVPDVDPDESDRIPRPNVKGRRIPGRKI